MYINNIAFVYSEILILLFVEDSNLYRRNPYTLGEFLTL